MTDRVHDMIRACFAADSLSLGVHWIYDVGLIRSRHGKVTELIAPDPMGYHSARSRGDFTHYGDQTFVLLSSVAASQGFDLEDFFSRWSSLMDGYDGFLDMATKTTLKRIRQGMGPDRCGSASQDMGGAARIAPLFLFLKDDPDRLLAAVRDQTRMTHQGDLTLASAAFFTRTALQCLEGTPPVEAIRKTALDHFKDSVLFQWVGQGLEATEKDSTAAIAGFGQACHAKEVFGGAIQLIGRYEDQLSEALRQAVTAGGESAARASIVAMVLAAYQGMDAPTRQWFEALSKKQEIDSLLEKATA